MNSPASAGTPPILQCATGPGRSEHWVLANVLDQRALVLEAGGVRLSTEHSRLRDRAGGAMFFASILGTVATLLRR